MPRVLRVPVLLGRTRAANVSGYGGSGGDSRAGRQIALGRLAPNVEGPVHSTPQLMADVGGDFQASAASSHVVTPFCRKPRTRSPAAAGRSPTRPGHGG